jgi:hypothetical protein
MVSGVLIGMSDALGGSTPAAKTSAAPKAAPAKTRTTRAK